MRRLLARLSIVALVSVPSSGTHAEEAVSGGHGILYMAARPGRVLIVDEATFKITGEIPLPRARPGISYPLQLSEDKKRFYSMAMNLEEIEVVDIASRKVTSTVTLSEGNKKVRLGAYDGVGESGGRVLAMSAKAATKLIDRFEIGPSTLYEYDLVQHKVARTIPWPKGEEREAAALRYSPDGKWLYLFADDVFVYDTTDLKVVDTWEISRPLEDGFGRINLGPGDDVNEEPGFLTGLFNVDDPLQHRKLMGIARVDLRGKKMDFWTVGPAMPVRRFALAPGRKKGYALLDEIGHYEIWTFDLEGRRLEKRTPFAGRPRMELCVSSSGNVLYVSGAGNTIDLYDAATHRYLRTVTFDSEISSLYVFPPGH
ncbi:MAG TPA: hypothetical protein VMV21_17770 [Vicinamibacteria bacterium]|nr:hypothetical protein [Vicinamibacteria bacterium]